MSRRQVKSLLDQLVDDLQNGAWGNALTPPRGHAAGAGRSEQVHGDKRSRRKRTRKAANDAAIKEEQ